MPDLFEFVAFVCEKSGIRKASLVEKDVLIHRILKEVMQNFGNTYLFKGGSCLVKCYFGYYRFSVDLDFTWKEQDVWKRLGKKMLRRKLVAETQSFAEFLENVAGKIELDFRAELGNKNYIEFGSGNRMVTFKLWKGSELIKVQVNFVENLLFPKRKMIEDVHACKKRYELAITLLRSSEISERNKELLRDSATTASLRESKREGFRNTPSFSGKLPSGLEKILT